MWLHKKVIRNVSNMKSVERASILDNDARRTARYEKGEGLNTEKPPSLMIVIGWSGSGLPCTISLESFLNHDFSQSWSSSKVVEILLRWRLEGTNLANAYICFSDEFLLRARCLDFDPKGFSDPGYVLFSLRTILSPWNRIIKSKHDRAAGIPCSAAFKAWIRLIRNLAASLRPRSMNTIDTQPRYLDIVSAWKRSR